MAGDFTSSYQRTKYWLDLLWPDREKQQQKDRDRQAAQEQQQDTEQQGPSDQPDSEQTDAERLREADFEDGYRYEQTGHDTYLVQQYPTGRYIGELRQNEEGRWQARHRPDADWEDAHYDPPGVVSEGQAENYDQSMEQRRRTSAAAHLEERHCGEVEAGLIQRGIYLDYDGHYSLDILHNADNALHKGVERGDVDAYMRHHAGTDAEPNEHTVATEAVPGSIQWNTAHADVRQQILTTSPWAAQQNHGGQQQQLSQHVAQQQINEQVAATQRETTIQGAGR